jgi:hypothetical protein
MKGFLAVVAWLVALVLSPATLPRVVTGILDETALRQGPTITSTVERSGSKAPLDSERRPGPFLRQAIEANPGLAKVLHDLIGSAGGTETIVFYSDGSYEIVGTPMAPSHHDRSTTDRLCGPVECQ